MDVIIINSSVPVLWRTQHNLTHTPVDNQRLTSQSWLPSVVSRRSVRWRITLCVHWNREGKICMHKHYWGNKAKSFKLRPLNSATDHTNPSGNPWQGFGVHQSTAEADMDCKNKHMMMFNPLVKQLVNNLVNILPHVLFYLYAVHHLQHLRLLIAVWHILRWFFFLNATVINEICVRLHCEVNVILGRKLKFQNITAATKCTVLHVPFIHNCLFLNVM